jgi:hypothetical protein
MDKELHMSDPDNDFIKCPYCSRVMQRRDFVVHRKAAGHSHPGPGQAIPVRDWPAVPRPDKKSRLKRTETTPPSEAD